MLVMNSQRVMKRSREGNLKMSSIEDLNVEKVFLSLVRKKKGQIGLFSINETSN